MNDKLFIGLDVGTDSVGWAATDEDYNLLRLKGKTAWGSRIFPEASSAETRRAYRVGRRRLARRRFRLDCLEELFTPLIVPQDPNFFARLRESKYIEGDKSDKSFIHPLFGSAQDKEFFEKYPTIWHLRLALMKDDPDAFSDIRNVYFAIHHIIKYRGNFLNPNENMAIGQFDEEAFAAKTNLLFNEIAETPEEDGQYELLNREGVHEILSALRDDRIGKTEKKKKINAVLNKVGLENAIPFIDFFVNLLVGSPTDTSKLGEEFEKTNVVIGRDFDEKKGEFESILGENFALVELAKEALDFVELEEILNKCDNLSEAFVSLYECHKQTLEALKKIVVAIDEKRGEISEKERLYFILFKDPDNPKNYPAFVHVGTNKSRPSIHDFDAYVIASIKPYEHLIPASMLKHYEIIKQFAESDKLLKTIALSSTSVIPHQLHRHELEIILDNAVKHFPAIKDIKDKIIDTFLYKIPYYCGPLNPNCSPSFKGRVVFKGPKQPIRPWNYLSLIDFEQTKTNFMESLKNQCQYLPGESVLPRQSVLFMDYVILNRLNTMFINGKQIEQEVKLDLFENLICQRKKTTVKGIKRYLETRYPVYKIDKAIISGVNETDDFDSSTRFALKDAFDLVKDGDMVERIIYLLAVYSDSQADALDAIKGEFPKLNEAQWNAIKKLSVNGWAPLSRKLLKGIVSFDENGVGHCIVDLLFETTLNFIQILYSPDYSFQKLIEEAKNDYYGERSPREIVEEILDSVPPAVKRQTIQAVRIVEEIARAAKKAPDRVVLEVTRQGADPKKKGKMTNPRYATVERFLKGLRGEGKEVLAELHEIEAIKLKSKHLFLYFMQNGIDVYTGKRIDINDILSASGKYDIDHIYPQSKIRDDSFDNMVLVEKTYNQRIKRDIYPIPEEIRCNPEIVQLWKMLLRNGGISSKKYNRLIRATPLADEELNDFVAAQLNAVNYSNKVIRDILEFKFPNTEILFSKAEFPSQVRQMLGIYKLRDLNDAHHAVDAYLNIVSGTLLHDRYLGAAWKRQKSEGTVWSFNMIRYLENRLIPEGVPTPLGEKMIAYAGRTDFLITYRVAYSDREFYDANPKAKGKINGLIPLHTSDPRLINVEAYGGYNSLTSEYMVVARVREKNKEYKYLVSVPHLWISLYGHDEALLKKKLEEDFLQENSKAVSVDIDLSQKLRNRQKIEAKGLRVLLSSFNINQVSIFPIDIITLPLEDVEYLHFALMRIEDLQVNSFKGDQYEFYTDTAKKNIHVISKERNVSILKKLLQIAENPKYDYLGINIQVIRAFGDDIDAYLAKRLDQQIADLMNIIKALGRTGPSTSDIIKSETKKARGVILNDEFYIFEESVTGLYSRKIKI